MSETTLPVKTQGRTLDCPFNFRPPRIVAVWFLMCRCQVCNRTAVARVRAGERFNNTTLRAGSPWWSSGSSTRDKRAPPAGRPTHKLAGADPRNGLLRQVSPPGARGTVASLLVHVPAALRECRAHGTHTRRAPPAGDRPKERRAPSLGLEGTNPWTGRRYF